MKIAEKVMKNAKIAEKNRRFEAKTAEKMLKKISAASRRKLLEKKIAASRRKLLKNTNFSAIFCLKKTLFINLIPEI